MRARRFWWHWPKTWLILQAVNMGMFVGAPLELFGWERAAMAVAVVAALVVLLRGWVRMEAATPLFVHATKEDDAAVKMAMSLGPRGAQGSAIRFLFPFAGTLAIVLVAVAWVLARDWVGRSPGLRAIPEWVFGWIAVDALIAGLAVVATAYYAFEPLDQIVGIWVNANHEAWSSFTARLGTFPLPKPTLIGEGYVVLGAFDIRARNGPTDLARARSHVDAFEHRIIPWPGVSRQSAEREARVEPANTTRPE